MAQEKKFNKRTWLFGLLGAAILFSAATVLVVTLYSAIVLGKEQHAGSVLGAALAAAVLFAVPIQLWLSKRAGDGLFEADQQVDRLEQAAVFLFTGRGALRSVVVDRSIEIPAAYRGAAQSLLAHFGEILEKKIPESQARIRIEQEGLLLRLVVESAKGQQEVIEKALDDYGLVLAGAKKPEDLLENPLDVVNLNAELALARTRLEMQHDLLASQGQEIQYLRGALGDGIRQEKPVTIELHQQTATTVSQVATQQTASLELVPTVLDAYRTLLTQLPSEVLAELGEGAEEVEDLEKAETPEEAKRSAGFSKVKRLADLLGESGSAVSKALKGIDGGVEAGKNLAEMAGRLAGML